MIQKWVIHDVRYTPAMYSLGSYLELYFTSSVMKKHVWFLRIQQVISMIQKGKSYYVTLVDVSCIIVLVSATTTERC